MLMGCVVLFGRERGAEVEAMVERLAGGPCPCKTGRTCPMLPDQPSSSARATASIAGRAC